MAAIESALRQHGISRRVIIIDQGSRPENVARIAAALEGRTDALLRPLGRNVGVAAGRNLGATLGHGRIIVSLDNDAVFATDDTVAGLCAALRLYHEALGVPIATLPMAVPVNLRADADPAGGNRFAGVNLGAPIGVADPVVRIQKIRKQMIARREEAAIDIVGAVAPLLSLLPDAVLQAMSGSVIASDVQASNVPIYPGDTFIAGAKVLRQFGIGPLPGVGMMVVLVSRGGFATVTARYDRAAIAHPELFAQCLRQGFDEVLALAGDPQPRVVPVSFPDLPDQTAQTMNGSVAYT